MAKLKLPEFVRGHGYEPGGQIPTERNVIYAMVNWRRRGIKVGKTGSLRGRWCGATGDKGEVRWYGQMRDLDDPDNNHRIFTSPYCFDAHRFGPDDFEIFVLEQDVPTPEMRCREHAWIDAVKRDPNWVDYNDEKPCRCWKHGAYGSYLRAEAIFRAMDRYRHRAETGALGSVLQELALRPLRRRRR
jgi:hypothetical protein